MKNTMVRSICTSATILIFVVLGQIAVTAQEGANSKNNEQYAKNIEGGWNHVTTRLNCQTGAVLGTFQAMFTFSEGGTFWEASSNVSPALRAASHGVWSFDSKGTYHTA